jgi:hypothetical protein
MKRKDCLVGYRATRLQLLRQLTAEVGRANFSMYQPRAEKVEAIPSSDAPSIDSSTEPSMAIKRAFYYALGFQEPLTSGDWNPRLGGRFEFPIVGARKIEDPWREVWDRATSAQAGRYFSYCTGETVLLAGIRLQIAYRKVDCLNPIGLFAQDSNGELILFRGSEVGWDPEKARLVAEFRLAASKLGENEKRIVAESLSATVVLSQPGLMEKIRTGSKIESAYLTFSIGPTETQTNFLITPAVRRSEIGYFVESVNPSRRHFVQADTAIEALQTARMFWALDDLSWILGIMFHRDIRAPWSDILPHLTAAGRSKTVKGVLDDRSTVDILPNTFRQIGDITASLGAYFIPADESNGDADDRDSELFDFCLVLGGGRTDVRVLLRLEFSQMQLLLKDLTLERVLEIAPQYVPILSMLQRYPKWLHGSFMYGGRCGYRELYSNQLAENNPFVLKTVGGEEIFVDRSSSSEHAPGIMMTWGLKQSNTSRPTEVIVVEQGSDVWYYTVPHSTVFHRTPRLWADQALALAKARTGVSAA